MLLHGTKFGLFFLLPVRCYSYYYTQTCTLIDPESWQDKREAPTSSSAGRKCNLKIFFRMYIHT